MTAEMKEEEILAAKLEEQKIDVITSLLAFSFSESENVWAVFGLLISSYLDLLAWF